MELKSIGVLSCGKVMGILYAVLGLIFGGLFSMFALIGLAFQPGGSGGDAVAGLVFGIGAVLFLPIFYGMIGFIGGLIMAFLYNLIARYTGGLELQIEMPELVARQFD